jgi:hypothetical protein
MNASDGKLWWSGVLGSTYCDKIESARNPTRQRPTLRARAGGDVEAEHLATSGRFIRSMAASNKAALKLKIGPVCRNAYNPVTL